MDSWSPLLKQLMTKCEKRGCFGYFMPCKKCQGATSIFRYFVSCTLMIHTESYLEPWTQTLIFNCKSTPVKSKRFCISVRLDRTFPFSAPWYTIFVVENWEELIFVFEMFLKLTLATWKKYSHQSLTHGVIRPWGSSIEFHCRLISLWRSWQADKDHKPQPDQTVCVCVSGCLDQTLVLTHQLLTWQRHTATLPLWPSEQLSPLGKGSYWSGGSGRLTCLLARNTSSVCSHHGTVRVRKGVRASHDSLFVCARACFLLMLSGHRDTK